MKLEKIRLLHSGSGDWEGFYVNGNLIFQGHHVELPDVIRYIFPNIDFENVWSEDEYFEKYGNMCPQIYPDDLE
jgi:hypothetical protein